jgi:hypothetical protein
MFIFDEFQSEKFQLMRKALKSGCGISTNGKINSSISTKHKGDFQAKKFILFLMITQDDGGYSHSGGMSVGSHQSSFILGFGDKCTLLSNDKSLN